MPALRHHPAARLTLLLVAVALTGGVSAQQQKTAPAPELSTGGRLAKQRIDQVTHGIGIEGGGCVNEPECEGDEDTVLGATSLQSETSIAVDATGQHVVVGFNDFRGFSGPATRPISLSGYMYSDDGGQTFKDGGQLPTIATDLIGGQLFPQIFGDPDVKYVGGCTFVYASIGVIRIGVAGLAQTMVVHRSTDCGHTWTGPFEIPPATNPGGEVDGDGNALDAADKELTDVDPDTGRYAVCWTNFTEEGVEMSCTYSDNILSALPTFAPRTVVGARPVDGQGSSVRFAGNGSPNALVAWTAFSGLGNRISVARSSDNGQTWSAPTDITSTFFTMDEVLGNDRVNNFPSVAFDTSTGPFRGRAYVAYSNNNSRDGADVMIQRSGDGGATFTAPVALNSRPGNDRAQWFPFVTVDKTTGRVTVFYYDQGIDTSGHLTEVTYTSSDDGGATWTPPSPLSDRPFKAGWGNDTSQPNMGDYNQAVAQFGTVYASFAATRPVGFTDGQPATSFTTPDVVVKALPLGPKPPLRLGTPVVSDTGANGAIDPGEQVALTLPLANYVTNALNASTVTGIIGTLSAATPGVTVVQPSSGYPGVGPGAAASNSTPFVLQISPSVRPGTSIELTLTVTTGAGVVVLPVTLQTGTAAYTTLLSENFDTVAPGAVPAGWTRSHGAGPNAVPWTTTNAFAPSLCGTSNKAFHQEADDAPGSDQSRWERLFSPTLTVPALSQYVSVDFDVCYDTEDDPSFRILAYDGFFLRVTDVTPGRTVRSVLAEAFEQEFTTDGFKHYPKHLPRNSDPSYFQDMSAWAGASGGIQHVHLELPGMEGSQFQLRFEYAQDQFGLCTDVRPGHPCGVAVDNVVVRNVVATAQPSVTLAVTPSLARDTATGDILATVTVTNTGTATASNVVLTSVQLGGAAPLTPLPALGDIPAGSSASAVVRFPGSAAASGGGSVLRVLATFSGGTAGGTFRVIVP